MASKQMSWRDCTLSTGVLIRGPEKLLADRALARLKQLGRNQDPSLAVTEMTASGYQAGSLDSLTSPSLFGEARLVVIPDFESADEDLGQDLASYLAAPQADCWVVAMHDGSNKGKRQVDKIKKAGAREVKVARIKNARDKLSLVVEEVRTAGGRIEPAGAQLLVDALGGDLAELIGAARQLVSDYPQAVTLQGVQQFYGSRVGATGFNVADAAAVGNLSRALVLLRQAFSSGVEPVAIGGALALKFRNLAKVSARGVSPTQLGMAPWQMEKARREVRGWSDTHLAEAIKIIAQADEDAKGASRDPQYALEAAVRKICLLRQS
ncbi:DNA polymerase III subunit delta [Varibaculum cambriense]|uniref:DNA polymerase III subunit delta n=1 Tax=Varibaculum cambriense TaxID=184870 RepID=UPI002903C224|nr:DNA polymerase III subunit delta [Varibaculum cambriense]MDU1223946.1 DNA polymerase III subunit delta [Varibaculum cambriense]